MPRENGDSRGGRRFFGTISAENILRAEGFGRLAMSKESKALRDAAADELRESRNGGTRADKKQNVKRAAALKSLAQSEEWLKGEKERSKRRRGL